MKEYACSIIIVGYNSAADLGPCLESVFAQRLALPERATNAFEVILVDNASADETESVVAKFCNQHGERMRYLPLDKNVGFAAGNNVGAAQAMGEVVVLLNPDTIVNAGWLDALVQPFWHDEQVGMTTSRIVRADQPHLLNACGNDITWTGITVCRGIDEPMEAWTQMDQVAAVSGASFAIPTDLFDQLGGFDERFFMYYEDTDLSNRVRMLGYKILYTPDSIVRHKYVFKFSAQKAYYQERNRWISLLKILRFRTLMVLLPGLLIGELMAWTYAAMSGFEHVWAKAQGWQWIWQHRAELLREREAAHTLRKQVATETDADASDRALIQHWSPNLRFTGTMPDLPAKLLEGCMQPLLRGYGMVCRLLTA